MKRYKQNKKHLNLDDLPNPAKEYLLKINIDNISYIRSIMTSNEIKNIEKYLAEMLKNIKDCDIIDAYKVDDSIMLNLYYTGENIENLIFNYNEVINNDEILISKNVYLNLNVFYIEVKNKEDIKTCVKNINRVSLLSSLKLEENEINRTKDGLLIRKHTEDINKEFEEYKTVLTNLYTKGLYGNLELHYQPQIRLKDNSKFISKGVIQVKNKDTIQAEALLRCNIEGVPYPTEKFIRIAEKTGHILNIGEWVLETTMIQIMEWIDAGYDVGNIAINVSPIQIGYCNFTEKVRRLVVKHGIDPRLITLEITESTLLPLDNVTSTLQELKALGFKIAIDDFGTGYSNFTLLDKKYVDIVKIDKSIVTGIEVNLNKYQRLKSLINMLVDLGFEIVIEGLEIKKQVYLLQTITKTDITYQGYYFHKPMNNKDLSDLYHKAQ